MRIIKILESLEGNKEYTGEDVIADMYYQFRITNLDKPIVISFPVADSKKIYNPKVPIPTFNFISKYDVNVISFGMIGSKKDNYFITPKFSDFIEELGELLKKFKIRLGYSNSQGGFGIGTYAKALNLDFVLLYYPVSTKKIDLVPWDTRLSTKNVKHLHWLPPYNDVNLGDAKGYIIYDPLDDIDANHAKRFKGLKHIKVNGLVHGGGYNFLVKNSDVIQDVARDFFYKQELDLPNFRLKVKKLRLSRTYYEGLLRKKPKNTILLKNQKKLLNNLDNILNKPSDSIIPDEVNLIRDSAIALEAIDLKKSLALMKLAHKLRPKGPVIMNKITEYKKKLNKRIK